MKNSIANLVKHQFPDFYRESGEDFIAFIEAYYEWMEQEGKVNHTLRQIPDLTDIDKTTDEFLSHFRETYMSDLPKEIIGNQRLFQKHILDIYRSKGSLAAVKLLFRLLYNEDVEVYIPSYDIFATSDGKWVERRYIEVAYNKHFNEYQGRVITGLDSNTKAVVENAISFVKRGRRVYALYVTNIQGKFKVGERLKPNGLDIPFTELLYPLGSPETVTVNSSSPGFTVGEIFEYSFTEDDMKLVVTEVGTSAGTIEFTIEDGGTFYSMDADVAITAGSNTSGSGALFEIAGIGNTFMYTYTTDRLSPMGGIRLNAASYGFPKSPSANSATTIESSLNLYDVEVGTINRLRLINPGGNYDGTVTVTITDPYTATGGNSNGRGGLGGTDAIVMGRASMGEGTILDMKLLASGHGHNNDQSTYIVSNETGTVNFTINTGGVGIEEGYFDNTDGFTSSDKYLYDGHYYQEFSYVIRSSQRLEDYRDILLKTAHIAGNAMYGEIRIIDNMNFSVADRSNDGIAQEFDMTLLFGEGVTGAYYDASDID